MLLEYDPYVLVKAIELDCREPLQVLHALSGCLKQVVIKPQRHISSETNFDLAQVHMFNFEGHAIAA